jgi:hypothetical protein
MRWQVALKEWRVVCDALASGRQIILLRKGGIYEAAGEFEIEHRDFLLFPTYVHQKSRMIKPDQKLEERTIEPAEIQLSVAGQITDILPITDRKKMDALDAEHIWAPALIDMRFNYRPENPLYLLLVRASKLANPITIPNTPAYAGCKSWVPLENPVEVDQAVPALGDGEYQVRRGAILEILQK